jgi:hypothetical protein
MAEDYGHLDSKKVVLQLRGQQVVYDIVDKELDRLVREKLQREQLESAATAPEEEDSSEVKVTPRAEEGTSSPLSDIQIR